VKSVKINLKAEMAVGLAFASLAAIVLILLWPLLRDSAKTAEVGTPADLLFWQIQSIDTMKYSRDLAREKSNDESFDAVIDDTMEKISQAGCTHAAIGTPYDEEFFPMIGRWVKAARKYNLNVWFRGNWSGWEGWFDYPPISPEEHSKKTGEFIINHSEIFTDGDCFSACPECENGALGDPRETGEVDSFRAFLIDEQAIMAAAFNAIGKRVNTGLINMSADVAALVMDQDTTAALGGMVTIDHYVATPERLKADIENLIIKSRGRIMLGEFGVPIPDINGDMNPAEQAAWINAALDLIAGDKRIVGVNYWLGAGGTSALWSEDQALRPAYFAVKNFFQPQIIQGVIMDESEKPLGGATASFFGQTAYSDNQGYFSMLAEGGKQGVLTVESSGYYGYAADWTNDSRCIAVVLSRKNPGAWFNYKKKLIDLFYPGGNFPAAPEACDENKK